MRKTIFELATVLFFILFLPCFNSPIAQAETVVQDMGMTPDEFRERFNSKSREIGADIQIGSLTNSKVGETSIYQHELAPGIGIVLHTVNKTGNLCRASLTYTPVKSSGYNTDFIHAYAVSVMTLMIAATSTNTDSNQISKVFEGLGLTSSDDLNVSNYSSTVQIGDTQYGIKTSTDGLTFYIEQIQPPIEKSDTSSTILPKDFSSKLKLILFVLLLFGAFIFFISLALKQKYSLRTKTAAMLSISLLAVLIGFTAILPNFISKDNSSTRSIDTKQEYSTKEGIIEEKAIIAVDNDAFMELSYMISQENILGMMRLEQEGKAFILHSPAKCKYSDSIMHDGVVLVTIEDGEYALKSGITWKTFIR